MARLPAKPAQKKPLEMKYSVIIPCHNSGELLFKTVASALEQTLPPFEIMCVENGSTDATWENIQRLERETGGVVRGLQHEDRSVSVRARAINEARGDWMALLDHDDLWLPEKMERQAKLAEQSKFLCSALYEQVEEDECTRRFIDRVRLFGCNDAFKVLFHRIALVPCAVTLHRDVFERCGPFTCEPTKRWSSDFEMWLRVARHDFSPAFDPEPQAVRRIHGSNMSGDPLPGLSAHVASLEEYRGDDEAVKRAGGKVAVRRAIHWRRLSIAALLIDRGDVDGASDQIRRVRREARFDPMTRRLWGKALGENLLKDSLKRDLHRVVKEMRRWCIELLNDPDADAAKR